MVMVVVIFVVVAASLTADFARWESDGVNVRVSGLRQYRLRKCVKVTGLLCVVQEPQSRFLL